MTMRPDLANRYARSDRAERRHLVEQVQAELRETAPSVKVVGTINFATRVVIDEREVERLRTGLADRFLVENDYKMVTL